MTGFGYRRRTRRWAAALGTVLVVLAAAWVVGLVRFAAAIPVRVEDPDTRTAAIVVLTGGSQRLNVGLDLLAAGMAEKLFVSGVYHGVDVQKLLELAQKAPGELECCIVMGHAENTVGNAAETALWVRKNGIASLRLVTSNYHMPRSLLEFHRMLPDTPIIPHPVFPETVRREGWWTRPATAALIAGEYTKMLLAWGRHRLVPPRADLNGNRASG